jgi:hypothetical protein
LADYFEYVYKPANPEKARDIVRSPARGPRGKAQAAAKAQQDADIAVAAAAAAAARVGPAKRRRGASGGQASARRLPDAASAAAEGGSTVAQSNAAAVPLEASEASPRRIIGTHALRAKPAMSRHAMEAAEAAALAPVVDPPSPPPGASGVRTRSSPGGGAAGELPPAKRRKAEKAAPGTRLSAPDAVIEIYLNVLDGEGPDAAQPQQHFHWKRVKESMPGATNAPPSVRYWEDFALHVNQVVKSAR